MPAHCLFVTYTNRVRIATLSFLRWLSFWCTFRTSFYSLVLHLPGSEAPHHPRLSYPSFLANPFTCLTFQDGLLGLADALIEHHERGLVFFRAQRELAALLPEDIYEADRDE